MRQITGLLISGFLGLSGLFSVPVPAEELAREGHTAFRLHRDGMNSAEIADFNYGRGLFHHVWAPVIYSNGEVSGFGPLYNTQACAACHINDGRGHAPEAGGDGAETFIMRLAFGFEDRNGYVDVLPDPVYGFQFQDHAIAGFVAEGRVKVSYSEAPVALADGSVVMLRTPSFSLVDLGYGPLSETISLGPRIAPQLIGLGLLQDIPQSRLEELEDPTDADGDGISGEINWRAPGTDAQRLPGRFGWKSTTVSVLQQSSAAANGDMGLSNPVNDNPAGDCTLSQNSCVQLTRDTHFGKGVELDGNEMFKLVFYTANLRVPDARIAETPGAQAGEELFSEIGCAACHVPAHTIQDGTQIRPYSDLLIHDMGPGLADGIKVGNADFAEWRTSPLWGIGLTEIVSGYSNYLHDGRARTLSEAIVWHGGEGEASRNRFLALNTQDRNNLLAFLSAL